ncbi:MAG TPA: AgmX/PglI C-terminal domain-containing protein [Polyangiaceae bacterium]|nr:AgmX/PglI C-terminal domain-containing protein [Polyangiaceae bacterium]
MTAPAAAPANVLRVAATWGTTIIGVQLLEPGQDCLLGEARGALAALPDGLSASGAPLRAVGNGWELDARGALSGVLILRGREENVAGLGQATGPVPVVPGDYGLIQYGLFSVFFQYTAPAPPLVKRKRSWLAPLASLLRLLWLDDPLVGLSQFSSIVLHLGIIGLLIVNWTPDDYRLPPELVSPEEYAARFGLKRVLPEMEPPAAGPKQDSGGKGVKDPGAKDTKKQGGGQKILGKEGKAGLNGKEDHSELPGEITPTTKYGGLSEALADTGTEIKKTLSEIATVADALGGLNSSNVVLGSGPGTGLRGTGSGGGGTGAGVMFGSGTLNTGWGPGIGGGFGTGSGGPGGRGSGGFGNGGSGGGGGTGNGTGNGGPGEHGLQGGGGGVAAHGGLSAEQIRRVVLAHKGALQACYEIEAQKDPTLRGGVTIAWTIDSGGGVTSVNVAGSTIHNARVEGCVQRQVRTWHFPASDGVSQAQYPFSFGIGR